MMRYEKQIETLTLGLIFIFGSLISSQAVGQTNEGLVAYFKFEEGKGKTLNDYSGIGNDATITGDVEWVEGKYNRGLKFDGKSSYADIPTGKVGPLFEAVTITAWVKVAKMPSSHSYNIAGMTTGPGSGFYVELYAVVLAAWQCQPNNTNASTPYPTTFNEWHHLAGVYTGKEILLYIDGEQKANGPGAALPSVAGLPFRISGNHSEVSDWAGSLDGVIDEVRLYNRALGSDEIKDSMKEIGMVVTPAGSLFTTWSKVKSELCR